VPESTSGNPQLTSSPIVLIIQITPSDKQTARSILMVTHPKPRTKNMTYLNDIGPYCRMFGFVKNSTVMLQVTPHRNIKASVFMDMPNSSNFVDENGRWKSTIIYPQKT